MSTQCLLQRYNQDTGGWDNLQYRDNANGGVISDHFFDNGVPARWGGATYRIYVNNTDGNTLGTTTLVGVALTR